MSYMNKTAPEGGGGGPQQNDNYDSQSDFPRNLELFTRLPESAKVCNNRIKTSKYTVLTFLPLNLVEQFRRAANVYFLIISILTTLPTSGKNAASLIVTFVGVLLFTAAKEAWEDYGRYLSDKTENNRQAKVYRDGKLVDVLWPDIAVGDVVKVMKGELFPCDLVFLASQDKIAATCYVDTCNLDGETNLKTYTAVETTKGCVAYGDDLKAFDLFKALNCKISVEDPKADLYNVKGLLITEQKERVVEPLKTENLLLRGCVLRNTPYVFGCALYTGRQSKIMVNSNKVPSKQSQVMMMMNKCLYLVFGLMALLCLGNSTAAYFWNDSVGVKMTYMRAAGASTTEVKSQLGLPVNSATFILEAFLTFVVGYSHLIPISLYFGLEMVKVIQKIFVDNDMTMYHEETNTCANSRTSNLIEDLGQVQFVFSDKTGTLTCNQMEFIAASIGNVIYGDYKSKNPGGSKESSSSAAGGGVASRHKIRAPSIPTIDISRRPSGAQRVSLIKSENLRTGFDFRGDAHRILKGDHADPSETEDMQLFWLCIAVCHGVEIDSDIVPTSSRKEPSGGLSGDDLLSHVNYQASSPDELALLNAARAIGYIFYQRNAGSVVLSVMGQRTVYEILHMIEFSSTRKRMTVVCKGPDGHIIVFCKGADDVIIGRAKAVTKFEKGKLMSHINAFSAQGLRTLCLAVKFIDEKWWIGWKKRYTQACGQVKSKDTLVEALENELESELEFLGATAIEDNLQTGVPDTIQSLREAGIKVWVLTGDKQGTAIDIGFSCNLLNKDMKLIILSPGEDVAILTKLIDKALAEAKEDGSGKERGIVINGAALAIALLPEVRMKFLELALVCEVCICCRVSPKQKAEVVRLVRTNLPVVTLAIGDGANDVAMIQEAHIGIGISGMEGTQAARSSDYSIAQFKHLKSLLFLHGRVGYNRVSTFLLYYFYKNVVLCLTEFFFAMYSGFSGQLFFPNWYSLNYNAFYTMFPAFLALGLDRDVSIYRSLTLPKLYYFGQEKRAFNLKLFSSYLLRTVYQGACCFFIPMYSLVSPYTEGLTMDNYYVGTASFTCVVILVTMQLFVEVSTWTKVGIIACLVSIGLFLCASLVMAIPAVAQISLFDRYSEGIFFQILSDTRVWLVLLVTLFAAMLPDIALNHFWLQTQPLPADIISEIDKGYLPKKSKVEPSDNNQEAAS